MTPDDAPLPLPNPGQDAGPDASPNPGRNPAPPPEGRRGPWPSVATIVAIIIAIAALAVAVWQWRDARLQLAETRDELTRRLNAADAADAAGKAAREGLQEQVAALEAKLAAVGGRLAEFENQGEALQSLYDNLARGREEVVLLEVEQALTLAAQQLQLAGNAPVAILALQTADAHLARLDKPRYLPLRAALARDLVRLNAMPFVDIAGISLRLEEIIANADRYPLAALDRPAAQPAADEAAATAPWWRLAAADAWQAVRGLIRIQRLDHEEPALLAPEQNFFLRENLKLRLLNARLALLSRDQETYRGELKMAQDWLKRHFSANDPAVQAAQEKLRHMLLASPRAEPPGLSDSLAALASVQGRGKGAR